MCEQISSLCLLFSSNRVCCHCGARHNADLNLSGTESECVIRLWAIGVDFDSMINDNLQHQLKLMYDYWFTQFDFPDENGKPYRASGGAMVWNEQLKREIPQYWSIGTVSDCVEKISTGLNPRDNFVLGNGSIRYITVKNLTTTGSLDFSGCDMIDEKARAIVHRRSDISVGDILFASIAPLGRCYLIQQEPTDWDINESVFSIRSKTDKITPEYLYLFFQSSNKYFDRKYFQGHTHKHLARYQNDYSRIASL